MLTVLAILGVLVVLFLAGALATRQDAALAPAVRDAADLDLPHDRPVRGADLRRVRFGLALRGYRMSEVDALLERLADELDDSDGRDDSDERDDSDGRDGSDGRDDSDGRDGRDGTNGRDDAADDSSAERGPALVPLASLPAAQAEDEGARPG